MAEQTITIPASTLFADTASQKRYDTNGEDAVELNRDLYTYVTDASIFQVHPSLHCRDGPRRLRVPFDLGPVWYLADRSA